MNESQVTTRRAPRAGEQSARSVGESDGTWGTADVCLPLPENRFAWTAFEQLGRRIPGQPSLSLFVVGPTGSGKTLLIRHFVRLALQANPRLRIEAKQAREFVHADFAADSASVTASQSEPDVPDWFILEDVSALDHQWIAQDALVHKVDTLLPLGVRIVCTAPRPPGELTGILPRLLNRWRGSLLVSLAPLSLSSRMQLLEHVATTAQLALSRDVLQTLAERVTGSARELVASVKQLAARTRSSGRSVTPLQVEQFLQSDGTGSQRELPRVVEVVARHFQLSVRELRARTRSQPLSLPRKLAMWLAHHGAGISFQAIGRYFGGRDHSTVLHACRTLSADLATDSPSRLHLTQLETALGWATTETDCILSSRRGN